jgi:hypothetical protein
MTTGSILDLDLRSALRDEALESNLRPSVLRSEFFRDYSLQRILANPTQARFDLLHTRGVGGKSVGAVSSAVARQLERSFPKDWEQARHLATGHTDAAEQQEWPVSAMVQFIETWLPHDGSASGPQTH